MMSNNKILTVSYGTFSCTLEGFDDAFGTMKAIAEYFRDLAADDRYFGAEPPQPDADMLARIAQKEISRRVEARQHEGKIVLSATGPDAETTMRLSRPHSSHPTPVAHAAAPASSTEPQPKVGAAEGVIDNSQPEEITAEVPGRPQEEAPAPQPADAFFAKESGSAAKNIEVEEDEDVVPSPSEAPAVTETAPGEAPRPDSIAAKLQRIRAVVAKQETVTDEDFDEEESAPAAPRVDPLADARNDIEHALDADDAADLYEEDEDDNDIAALLSRFDGDDTDETQGDTDVAQEMQVADLAEDPEAKAVAKGVEGTETSADATDTQTVDDSEDVAASASLASVAPPQDGSDDAVAADIRQTLDTSDEAPQPDTADTPAAVAAPETNETAPVKSAEAAPTQPRARVIKVKRRDLEAAISQGDLEEYEDENDTVAETATVEQVPSAPGRVSSLSSAEEDELARELAALEADMTPSDKSNDRSEDEDDGEDSLFAIDDSDDELGDGDGTDNIIADTSDDTPDMPLERSGAAKPAREALPALGEDSGADMNRLMNETESQMGKPGNATRRDAFAHLRAAVAAKKAEDAMGKSDAKADQGDAYRNDLADVVRPRRPVATGTRSARPEDARPAPLKLVAEQRIDVARPASAGPVRPRRVAAVPQQDAPSADAESFADFAAEMGATRLPQILEAAAAYLSFVEGRDDFSRPQLMSKVRQIGSDSAISREDGLRAFGQLLRAGKIEKIKGGRFTVSKDIGFRPDQRAVG